MSRQCNGTRAAHRLSRRESRSPLTIRRPTPAGLDRSCQALSRLLPDGSLGPCHQRKPATESREYEARHLLVLEGLEAVRKRPAMYIGSTDTRGLMHCLWEIIDNAVDEALGGYGVRSTVTLRADGGISVARPRPRHPGRHRAADRALRGRGRLHQAARRRQVRRRLLQRDRRPARRRRPRWSTRCPAGSTSRSTATARPGRCRSAAACPASSTEPGPNAPVHARRRPAQDRPARRRA